jgi:hypothetical protein
MLDGVGKNDSTHSIEYRGQGCCSYQAAKRQKHTTGGIPRWSPTLVLVAWFSAYVWQSGRRTRLSSVQRLGAARACPDGDDRRT